jgi:hypothetical protein
MPSDGFHLFVHLDRSVLYLVQPERWSVVGRHEQGRNEAMGRPARKVFRRSADPTRGARLPIARGQTVSVPQRERAMPAFFLAHARRSSPD